VCGQISTGYAHQCDFEPIQGQGQGYGATEVAKIALFMVYLLRRFGVELKTDDCW